MTEDDPTKDLNGEDSIKDLTENLPKGLTLEQKIDWLIETQLRFMARDTNPLPRDYSARFAAVEEHLARIERELVLLREDIRNERHERLILGEPVTTLEGRPN